MKALLLAEACNPEWTSVPLVGFNMVQALANRQDVDVVLVTHVRNRHALTRHPISRQIEICYIDNEWIAGPLYKLGKVLRGGQSLGWTTNMAINWPAYIAFEKQIATTFGPRLKAGEFDVVHRVTPVSPTLPSALATLTDVPMVIGPLNGGLPWPKQFPDLCANEREWLSPVRKVYRYFPWFRSSYRHLAAVISGSRHTASELPNCFTGRRFYLPENGIDDQRFTISDGWSSPEDAFQFISVGRLVPYKGFDMVLEALASSPILATCRLTIVGGGPERQSLEAMCEKLNLTERVSFAGWLEQAELSVQLRTSQAFVFPSLREFGGGVVLEAMASGLPSIVVNYGGPAELIDDSNGIRIPMSTRPQLVNQLIGAMETLAIDERKCSQMAGAAAGTIRQRYTWERKAATVVRWYAELTGHTSLELQADTAAPAIQSPDPSSIGSEETSSFDSDGLRDYPTRHLPNSKSLCLDRTRR